MKMGGWERYDVDEKKEEKQRRNEGKEEQLWGLRENMLDHIREKRQWEEGIHH